METENKTGEQMFDQAQNVNRARNVAIQTAFDSGAKWVFIIDGCSFLTEETYKALSRLVNKQNSSKYLHFIPGFRLEYKILLTSNLTYQTLFPYVSGRQECQIGIRKDFMGSREIGLIKSQEHLFFNEGNSYGKQDKLSLLITAHKHLSSKHLSCRHAFMGFQNKKSKTFESDQKVVEECGFALRMLYFPEPTSVNNQSRLVTTRFKKRKKAIQKFRNYLKAITADQKMKVPGT